MVRVRGVGMPALCSRNVVADLSTQRSMARASFQTRTPLSRKRMQEAEAEGDLLQRALRDRAHEHGVRQLAVKARNVDAAGELRVEGAARQRADDDDGAARAQRLGEPAHVPVAAFLLEEERDAQSAGRRPQRKLLSTTSGASSPAWKEEPVSRLETITSAGLNSMGSIL